MPILLKDQLKRPQHLNEIQYKSPIFNKKYYVAAHDYGSTMAEVGEKAGRRMFYDFYAIDQLWRAVGSGKYSKAMRNLQKDLPDSDPRKYFHNLIGPGGETFSGGAIVPEASVRLIDKIHDQVVRAVAKNLIVYIRMAVVQEFQYFIGHSHGWSQFRHDIVATKNQQVLLNKDEVDSLIKKNIPGLVKCPDTVLRLLKFSKIYGQHSIMKMNPDPYDLVKDVFESPEKGISGKEPVVPIEPGKEPFVPIEPGKEPKSAPTPGDESDETDYNALPPELPPGADYIENEPEYTPKNDPTGYTHDPDYWKKEKNERLLTEERIEVNIVTKVYEAMKESGVTIEDVEKAYNNTEWGDNAMGGPKWGDGALALIRLINTKKDFDTEYYIEIIDYIYDLQHNTGSLLNKGPMNVSREDLDIRYRTTHPARFLQKVSPLIRQLMVRYMKYFPGTDENLELNKDEIIKSPTQNFSNTEIQYLVSMMFTPGSGPEFIVPIHFVRKQPNAQPQVTQWNYTIRKHTDGKISLVDDKKSDIQVFDDFEEAKSYIEYKLKREIVGPSGFSQEELGSKSQKDAYLDKHPYPEKLSKDKEISLLKINIGRKGSIYEAYFPDGKRFQVYAFNDGTYLTTWKDSKEFNLFDQWETLFAECEKIAAGAMEFPDKENLMKALTAVPVPSSSSIPYTISPAELSDLEMLIDQKNASSGTSKYQLIVSQVNGMAVIQKIMENPPSDIATQDCFYVGRAANTGYLSFSSNPYKVSHILSGTSYGESWNFPDWNKTFNFIKSKLDELVVPNPIASQTSVTPGIYTAELPPYSVSKASYSVHTGIDAPPKNTIRLTQVDEDDLHNIGFVPKMIGNSIWYVHQNTKDGVKFFPNNIAKIVFGKPSATGIPMVTLSIEKMLEWLPTKYSSGMILSPLSSAPPAKSAPGGIQLASMFGKKIESAGFKWDGEKGKYFDGNNTLTIYKNRTSDLLLSNGSSLHFNTLPDLLDYLGDEYKK